MLRKFVEILIGHRITPCLDNLAVLRVLRLNPAFDGVPIGFFVGSDFSRAEQVARAGANILIGTLSREQIEHMRQRYPHLVFFAEVTDKASLDRALVSGSDGIQIKPWAKTVAALEQEGITLAALRRDYPNLLIAGAGGIFERTSGRSSIYRSTSFRRSDSTPRIPRASAPRPANTDPSPSAFAAWGILGSICWMRCFL